MEELPEEDEVRTFVGRKADYYVKRWPSRPEDEGGSMGFNWAAALLPLIWLGYRKMYGVAAIIGALIVVETILEYVFFVAMLGMPEPPVFLDALVGIVTGIICGAFGNRWYFTHAKKVISDVSLTEPEARKAALTKRGGTSWFGGPLVIIMFFVVSILGFILFDLSQA